MTGFFWNIRGFNKTRKQVILRSWIDSISAKFGCISETRVKENRSKYIIATMFPDWSFLSNYKHHHLGRLWILWSKDTQLTIVSKTSQMVTAIIQLQGQAKDFVCSFVYASNSMADRKTLWEDIRTLHNSNRFINKPWMICGDFNETLSSEDSSNESNQRISSGMEDFRKTINDCRLADLHIHGPYFTWTNKQSESLICKKLDRVLVNDRWVSEFVNSYSVFEAGGCSDHTRCRIMLDYPSERRKFPFKFANVLGEDPKYKQIMWDHWNSSPPLFVSTSALHRFTKKLKLLKPTLRKLGKQKLGDLTRRTKEAFESLRQNQEENLRIPNSINNAAEIKAYEKWILLANLEEGYLRQKSKLHWLNVGDRNNGYFHRSTLARRMRNSIREIQNEQGVRLSTNEEIKGEATSYFNDLLNSTPNDFIGCPVSELQEMLSFRCSDIDRHNLSHEVSDEEIKRTLFAMPNNKAPGPDGFTTEFFKYSWDVLGSDFIIAVRSFFNKGFLPKGVNSTILALIPKRESATTMNDYRPISCCNIIYKVVSKILANRLKEILPKFVVGNQSVFIKGRLLMENILLASEIVKDYHKANISPRCALKIDITKAFDTVQWSFILNILQALDFPTNYIHWIKLCISTPSFSVQVNGELTGYFNSTRGLRQGCPLSPYLFVICMNVLSIMMDKAAQQGQYQTHPKCKNTLLTHLCFADDLLLFMAGTKFSIGGALSVFDEFAKRSGLHISYQKSSIHAAGISATDLHDISATFNMEMHELPVRYLGLPLLTKWMSAQDYNPLIEKIKQRISCWTARFLSYAGRLELIKSVISGLITFWISAFRLPKSCIREINKLCSAFMWSGPDLKTSKAKIDWTTVCKPREEGGLGIRNLEEGNQVSSLKLIWKLLSSNDSLWVDWTKKHLLRDKSFWAIQPSTTLGSWIWKKLLKLRTVAKTFHRVKVRDGRSTSFWYDIWSESGCLHDVVGDRGPIDLGIPLTASIHSAINSIRPRLHRNETLNAIIRHLQQVAQVSQQNGQDIHLWRYKNDMFKESFSTKATWIQVHGNHTTWQFNRAIWFPSSTPKYMFLTWLAAYDRLAMAERMKAWSPSIPTVCSLCSQAPETRNHLFFECAFSTAVWKATTSKLLGSQFTNNWQQIITLASKGTTSNTETFLFRYAFQTSIYHIWRERNSRRHGLPQTATALLTKLIDKNIRNRLSSLRTSGLNIYPEGMQIWFATR